MGLFKMSKPDKYRKMASGEETGAPLLKFFDSEDCSAIYFLDGAKDMSCFSAPPTSNKKKLLCMLKPQPARYTKPDEMANIIIFDLSPKLLESMHALMEGVFLPIMSNPENQQAARPSAPPPPPAGVLALLEAMLGHVAPPLSAAVLCPPQGWSEMMAREVLENCHKTISASYVALGQSMGQTLLPQPPANMLVRPRMLPQRRAALRRCGCFCYRWPRRIAPVETRTASTCLRLRW